MSEDLNTPPPPPPSDQTDLHHSSPMPSPFDPSRSIYLELGTVFYFLFKVYKGNENYRPNFSTAERISRHDELRHHMPRIYQERQDVNGESSHSEDEPDKETGETNAEEVRV